MAAHLELATTFCLAEQRTETAPAVLKYESSSTQPGTQEAQAFCLLVFSNCHHTAFPSVKWVFQWNSLILSPLCTASPVLPKLT